MITGSGAARVCCALSAASDTLFTRLAATTTLPTLRAALQRLAAHQHKLVGTYLFTPKLYRIVTHKSRFINLQFTYVFTRFYLTVVLLVGSRRRQQQRVVAPRSPRSHVRWGRGGRGGACVVPCGGRCFALPARCKTARP